MADGNDPSKDPGGEPGDEPVEQRSTSTLTERRAEPQHSAALAMSAPLWPFRVLALAGAAVQGRDDFSAGNWRLWLAFALAALYTAVVVVRPIPHHDDMGVRLRVVVEQALFTALVMLTGAWASPLALCLIPSAMIAGFAAGSVFAAQLAASTILLVSAQFLAENAMRRSLNDVIVWTALIGTVVFTSGLAQRAGVDAARQRDAANVRVSRLAEANSLLFALQRVAQSMPASLDLDDVVDSTLKRVSSLVPADSLVLYLVNDTDRQLEVFRAIGSASVPTLSLDRLPAPIQPAVESPRTVREPHLADGSALTADGVSGVYTALRARGNLLGLLAIECSHPEAHTQQHSEIVHGLAESFGIAIDNARLFRQIRAASVNEERARIARDLHDHIGSSLAFLGFEVDRAQALAARGDSVDETLAELRGHITGVINEIRETLHDLRTDVTDDRDLPRVLGDHLARVRSRTALSITADIHASFRPPRPVERELWQLALEAITNVERHANAAVVHVEYRAVDGGVFLRIDDDGVGLNTAAPATDRYGMVGMRERAERIGATLRHEPMIPHRAAGTGTRVTVELRGHMRGGEATS